eukprot:10320160-Ditylum_brightwellii.AAC.1
MSTRFSTCMSACCLEDDSMMRPPVKTSPQIPVLVPHGSTNRPQSNKDTSSSTDVTKMWSKNTGGLVDRGKNHPDHKAPVEKLMTT